MLCCPLVLLTQSHLSMLRPVPSWYWPWRQFWQLALCARAGRHRVFRVWLMTTHSFTLCVNVCVCMCVCPYQYTAWARFGLKPNCDIIQDPGHTAGLCAGLLSTTQNVFRYQLSSVSLLFHICHVKQSGPHVCVKGFIKINQTELSDELRYGWQVCFYEDPTTAMLLSRKSANIRKISKYRTVWLDQKSTSQSWAHFLGCTAKLITVTSQYDAFVSKPRQMNSKFRV